RLARGEIPSPVLSRTYRALCAPLWCPSAHWPRARLFASPGRIAIGAQLVAGSSLAREKDMPESSGGAQSPEDVALKLLYVISWGENIDLEAWGKADRKWILDTYAECLQTVRD